MTMLVYGKGGGGGGGGEDVSMVVGNGLGEHLVLNFHNVPIILLGSPVAISCHAS